jgi:hypothetical protein
MKDEEQKRLRALLIHWIDHSAEHQQEYDEWAKKLKNQGNEQVFEYMHSAANTMKEVHDSLASALSELEKIKKLKNPG